MKIKFGVGALILALLALGDPARAAAETQVARANSASAFAEQGYRELFVDKKNPQCSDSNPGTEDKPFCTIQKGADAATPGAIVFVKEGVYPEMVKVTKSGKAGALIKFIAYDNHHVIVNSPSYAGFALFGVEYIKIHGFELTGAYAAKTPGIAHGGGIRAFPPDLQDEADPTSPDNIGVRHSAFTSNVIHANDAGLWLVGSHENLIADNVIYNSVEASIRIKRGDGNTIRNNLVFSNGTDERWGITFYCAVGTQVVHNTIYEPSGGAVFIYEGTSNLGGAAPGSPEYCKPSNKTQVYDNLMVVTGAGPGGSGSAPLVIGSSTTTDRKPILDQLYGPLDNRYHHNLMYHAANPNAAVSWGDFAEVSTFPSYALLSLEEFQHKHAGYGASSIVADPLFLDPAHWDFRLASNSPARGAASDGKDLGVDFAALPTFRFGSQWVAQFKDLYPGNPANVTAINLRNGVTGELRVVANPDVIKAFFKTMRLITFAKQLDQTPRAGYL
ncbi:MAG: NosD domain-containing protein, partial [Chloroflexota bacterium]